MHIVLLEQKRGAKMTKQLKCIDLQEDFLKDALLTQIRMLLDKRNLKFHYEEGDYAFAS